jgi:hypothetical protein
MIGFGTGLYTGNSDIQRSTKASAITIGSRAFPTITKIKDKPFWIWDQDQHKKEDINTKGNCCFNRIIGLPLKDGHDMPLLPYQRTLYDSL